MSITLDIPEALASELTMEASRAGLPLSDYVVTLLGTGRIAGGLPKTGAELVSYWEEHGIIGSRPDISDSLAHAQEVRRQAERRVRE
jgi:hypothetical protein